MKINEVTESLNRPGQYAWQEKSNSAWYGTFQASDGSSVEFSATMPNYEGWEISWTRNNISTRIKTDPGVAREIFATVYAMIQEFVTAMRPDLIFVALNGPDDTKMSIYHRILSKMGYSGYQVTDDEELEQYDLYPDYIWYIFS